ncbi:hypothetical protein ACS0TY_012316 [Phlomoides rotata]
MDLRPRHRQSFSGFTKNEVLKMEQLINDSKEQCMEVQSCKKLAKLFNRSSGRAGKPVVKWTEIQSWYQQNQQQDTFKETSSNEPKNLANATEAVTQNKATGNPNIPEEKDIISRLEFEARSSKDGAWYDVDTLLSYRSLSSGEIEIHVRYVGFGAEEDEWVNAKVSIRVRSIALEHSECHTVKVGDLVVCFQERQHQARYYDAHVLEIQRRWHDIRGCRCLFLIKYTHDNTEEKVRLRRLCCRPEKLVNLP